VDLGDDHSRPAQGNNEVGGRSSQNAPVGHGFISSRTPSGGSWGSLEHYVIEWNAADMGEVSSENPHPAGPSRVAQKMYEAELALAEALKAVENLILEHQLLSDKHKLLQAELQSKAGTKDQVDELLKRIADIQAEKKALEDRHKDCTSMSDLASQLKERDEKHQAELKKEQDEVSRLKAQLKDMKKEYKAEIEKVTASSAQTIAEEKERLEGQAQKYKDLLGNAEAHATSAQKELDVLKGKASVWLSELTRINSEMAKNFPHSEPAADTAVSKA